MNTASRRNPIGVLVAAILLVLPSFVKAQVANDGAITGTVTDPTGAAIPGATVTITSQDTRVARTVETDTSGIYTAESILTGLYTVTVTKSGFNQVITRDIQVDTAVRRSVPIVLQVGAITTEVTVASNALQVNTQTSENSGTITSDQINNLMMNGRNYMSLAIAMPGVASTKGADSLQGDAGSNLIINGMGTEYTIYTVDGVYDTTPGNLAGSLVVPTADGIQQMKVLKDSYSARYGLSGGAQIMVDSKSGTSAYHGRAWDYLRNSAFDATNYFSTVHQSLHQNVFGFTLGGPVVIPKLYNTNRTSKTFFFAANEWYLISSGQDLTGSFFTQAMRNGDFSASPTLTGSLKLDAASTTLLNSEGRKNCISGATTINTACFDPIAVALMNQYWPLPNNPSGGFLNYINTLPIRTKQLNYQYRLDQYIGTKNLLVIRPLYQEKSQNYPENQQGPGNPAPTITEFDYTTGLNALVRLTTTFTSKLINTLGLAEAYTKGRDTSLGPLPSGITINQAFPAANVLNEIPNVTLSKGWSPNGVGVVPVAANTGEGIVSDDVSVVKGNHVFQAGAEYMFGIKRQTSSAKPQGTFTFSGTHTGDPAADYLLGLDATYAQDATRRRGFFHDREAEAYFQDDWRATARLTLNLGLRYFYFSSDSVSGNQISDFNPSLFNPAQAPALSVTGKLTVNTSNQPLTSTGQLANLLNGLVFAGQSGVPSGFYIPSKVDFAPRVGFAYALTQDGKTSFRAGVGSGFQRDSLAQINAAFGANPPFNMNASVTNGSFTQPAAGAVGAPTVQTLTTIPLRFVPSQITTYSTTIERLAMRNMLVTVGYAGSTGHHLETNSFETNAPLSVTAPTTTGCLPAGQAASPLYDFDPCLNSGKSAASYTRPYLGYGSIATEYTGGSSNYNSLQASAVYRSGATQLNFAYTFSKALATLAAHTNTPSSLGATVQNPRNVAAEYGPPSFDFRHNLAATWVYDMPFFKTSANRLERYTLANWVLSGLFLARSGLALSPAINNGLAGQATRPNQIATVQTIGKVSQWFSTSSFVAPPYGFYGNASNGTIRGPKMVTVNVGLYRTIPVHENFTAQFRAEAFNVANHPNFINVNTGLGAANYGQVTSAGDPRILEFGLKLEF